MPTHTVMAISEVQPPHHRIKGIKGNDDEILSHFVQPPQQERHLLWAN